MGSFHRRTFSYDKLPTEPIRLSVLKLDGSSFEVYVTNSATVGDLKLAIETAFNHVPKKGPSKISWPHVWGHFCLCFDGQKLVNDMDYIGNYGLYKDGDEVRFKNYVSGKVLSKGYSRKSKERNLEREMQKDGEEEMGKIDGMDQKSWDDLEKGSFSRYIYDEMETSLGENKKSLSIVRSCCFRFGTHSRGYYSLRDTWRDD